MTEEGGILTEPQTSWKDGLSEETKSAVSGFETEGSLADGYAALYKKMGTAVQMPTDKTSDEERSAFYQKLGRPETIADYSRPELPEGQEFDESFLSEMAAVAHAEGVSDKQFRGFIDKYIGLQSQAAEAKVSAENAEADATQKQLHEDWGGDYDKNLEISKRALRELVPAEMKDDFIAVMTEKNLDNNMLFIKAFHSIGSKMMDDTLVKGELPKVEKGYVPSNPNSPDMYEHGEDEESAKARAYFRAKGHIYSRND